MQNMSTYCVPSILLTKADHQLLIYQHLKETKSNLSYCVFYTLLFLFIYCNIKSNYKIHPQKNLQDKKWEGAESMLLKK